MVARFNKKSGRISLNTGEKGTKIWLPNGMKANSAIVYAELIMDDETSLGTHALVINLYDRSDFLQKGIQLKAMNIVSGLQGYHFAELTIENFTVPRDAVLTGQIGFNKNGTLTGSEKNKKTIYGLNGEITERTRTPEEVLERLDEYNANLKLSVASMAIGAAKGCLSKCLDPSEQLCPVEKRDVLMPLLAKVMVIEQMIDKMAAKKGKSELKLYDVGILSGLKSLSTELLLDVVQGCMDCSRGFQESKDFPDYQNFGTVLRFCEGTNQVLIHPEAVTLEQPKATESLQLRLMHAKLKDPNNEYIDTKALVEYSSALNYFRIFSKMIFSAK